MATLPTPLEYGARPSLRSSRVDLPGQGELATGEALVQAVDTFNNVLKEKKGKQDRLNYALAKNEILQADIAGREALKDDEDWATFDERYSAGFNTTRDEILGKYQLSSDDRAILSSEANMIRERGRVQVGDYGRTVEIDEGMSRLNSGLATAREAIVVERDPETRNQILIGQLDAINAAEEKGYLDDDAAQKKRQLFTQDAALASLINMNPKEREKVLEASLAKRGTTGPITIEDIREGKGTGSIADFLHADTARKLLRETQDENKITDDRATAFAAVDEAWERYPEDAAARMKHIREATRGDADVRAIAESTARARNQEERTFNAQMRDDLMRSAGQLMETEGWTYDQIPESELRHLSPAQKATLRAYDKLLRNGKQFADVTNWHDEERDDHGNLVKPAYSTWADMTQAEQVAIDLTHPMWHTNFTQAQWKQFADQQDQIRNGKAPAEDNVQTNDQILQSVVVGNGFLPQTGRSDAQNAAYQRLRSRFADDVRALQEKDYGGLKAPYEERKNLLLKIIAEQAWKRDVGVFGFDEPLIFGDAEPEPIFLMTPAELKSGFIKIDLIRQQMTTVMVGDVPIDMTWEQRLINKSKAELDGRVPTEKDIENAYFAGRAGMSNAEILRRLAGKGDY